MQETIFIRVTFPNHDYIRTEARTSTAVLPTPTPTQMLNQMLNSFQVEYELPIPELKRIMSNKTTQPKILPEEITCSLS